MTYLSTLTDAMTLLAQDARTLFVGQNVAYDGQSASHTFDGVPMDRRIEFPVVEDMQLGFCTGLALQGYLPVCFYPRIDFMLLALNQLVLHLDKIPLMSGLKPKVIIRTAIGSTSPLNPGLQHCGDYAQGIRKMLSHVQVAEISDESGIIPAYKWALESDRSVIVVERMEKYRG